jgi:thioredoxin-related protein/YHS domain-containing protein
MRKQIVTDIYYDNFRIELFSKFVVPVRISVVAVVLFIVLFSLSRHLLAQNIEPIKWNNDVKQACQIAQVENRLVIVHFYNDCAPCNSMNANVFTDPRIALEMNRNFVAVRVDLKTQAALAQQYNVTVVPTDLIIKSDEQVVYRRQGEIAAEKYLQFLQYLRNNFLQHNTTTHYPQTITPNTQLINNVTNNTPNVVVPASTSPNPFPTRSDVTTRQVNPQNDPNVVTPHPQYPPNHPTFAINQPNTTTNTHDVIAASGQNTIHPNNRITNSNITPSTNLPNTNNNINTNSPPQTNNINTVIAKPDSPDSSTTGISVTNNPTLVRNPVVGSKTQDNNVESSNQLMVEVPLAIEGYCPVVLSKKEEWVPGNPAYYAMYRGQVYRFSSENAMEEFLKMPLKFAPVAMGEDIVMMIERNKKICGSRKYGVWFGGRVYLFANKESLDSFIAKPAHYASIAQNYEAAFKSPLDIVQR